MATLNVQITPLICCLAYPKCFADLTSAHELLFSPFHSETKCLFDMNSTNMAKLLFGVISDAIAYDDELR